MSSDLKNILNAFEGRGYCIIENAANLSKGDVWYKHDSSTADVEHVLLVTYKPKAKAYGVHVGVLNRKARERIIFAQPMMKSFLRPIFIDNPLHDNMLCWNNFDAGRALSWEYFYLIPNRKSETPWVTQFESLFDDFIVPNFFSIHDSKGVLNLLLRNYCPYEWAFTNPIFRAAEVILLGYECEMKKDELIDKFKNVEMAIYRHIHGDQKYSDVMDQLFDLFYR